MTLNEQSLIFHFFLGIGLLLFAWGYMLKRTRIDIFREDMFNIRDELFDYVWRNDLSFDLPAYRIMRDLLNGAIRAAEKINLVSFFVFEFYNRKRRGDINRDADANITGAIQSLDSPEHRHHFNKIYWQIVRRLLTFALLESSNSIIFKPLHLLYKSASILQRARDLIYETGALCSLELIELGRGSPTPTAKSILGKSAFIQL